MGDIESKLNLVNSKIRQNNRNNARRMVKPLIVIAVVLFLSCTIAEWIVHGKMTSDAMLTAGKTLKILSFVFAALAITAYAVVLGVGELEFNPFNALFMLVILIFILIGNGIFGVKSVYVDEASGGMVYYEKKDAYELRNLGNGVDVVINGTLNEKKVVSRIKICSENTRSLTLVNIDWGKVGNLICSDGSLEQLMIKDSTIVVKTGTFKNFKKLKNLYLENSEVTIDIPQISYYTQFYPERAIYLDNSSLNNLIDGYGLLIISGTSEYIPYGVNGIINTVVFNDSAVLSDNKFYKQISYSDGLFQKSYNHYFPLGIKIYIPSSIQRIPAFFFGNSMSHGLWYDQETIDVYYAGSEEDWNNIVISDEENSNYFDGKVIIHYNASPED